jgi:hypothetical protein
MCSQNQPFFISPLPFPLPFPSRPPSQAPSISLHKSPPNPQPQHHSPKPTRKHPSTNNPSPSQPSNKLTTPRPQPNLGANQDFCNTPTDSWQSVSASVPDRRCVWASTGGQGGTGCRQPVCWLESRLGAANEAGECAFLGGGSIDRSGGLSCLLTGRGACRCLWHGLGCVGRVGSVKTDLTDLGGFWELLAGVDGLA